ncbi:hypothetical protein DOTSEDRAFT_163787 [Dothistroma septosporum NZE10]|uniref:Uncharacterized protein n=1 Tax=Dothistroma septosporum (strain NZE10 / CBS 128990) TaxID=675120 RepID=N1Q175_DOTSN|nr:hypothetical protein DOTSEDRAFT_163787 [Dothistroma septosporum NZE10]
MSGTKRKVPTNSGRPSLPAAKKAKVEVLDYHLTPSVRDEDGKIQWPAPKVDVDRAREIIVKCANDRKPTVIVPDKDADGLSAGAILRHTLLLLELPKDLVHVHLLSKGNTVHSDDERAKIAELEPSYIFVVDQGSRAAPPLIASEHVGLIIDHHFAADKDFPRNSEHVTACHSPPVATSSLLTWHLCEPLHAEVASRCDWLCVVGTHGDLGNTLKWEHPFPDMKPTLKKYTKKTLNDVVSLINAPRRTATYDVRSAWDAISETAEPASILKNPRLLAARAEVNAEVERCTHTAPQFSPDGKIAVFRIASEAQVHPVIATRWSGHLQSKALEIVLVANSGYLPGKVNFSCRIPRCARGRDEPVDIIQSLRTYASIPDPTTENQDTQACESIGRPPLLERLGDDFARGHVQASGGIVSTEHFEELMARMQIGVKRPKQTHSSLAKSKSKIIDPGQKNTIATYFTKQ